MSEWPLNFSFLLICLIFFSCRSVSTQSDAKYVSVGVENDGKSSRLFLMPSGSNKDVLRPFVCRAFSALQNAEFIKLGSTTERIEFLERVCSEGNLPSISFNAALEYIAAEQKDRMACLVKVTELEDDRYQKLMDYYEVELDEVDNQIGKIDEIKNIIDSSIQERIVALNTVCEDGDIASEMVYFKYARPVKLFMGIDREEIEKGYVPLCEYQKDEVLLGLQKLKQETNAALYTQSALEGSKGNANSLEGRKEKYKQLWRQIKRERELITLCLDEWSQLENVKKLENMIRSDKNFYRGKLDRRLKSKSTHVNISRLTVDPVTFFPFATHSYCPGVIQRTIKAANRRLSKPKLFESMRGSCKINQETKSKNPIRYSRYLSLWANWNDLITYICQETGCTVKE